MGYLPTVGSSAMRSCALGAVQGGVCKRGEEGKEFARKVVACPESYASPQLLLTAHRCRDFLRRSGLLLPPPFSRSLSPEMQAIPS